MKYADRTIITFPGHGAVSREINAQYLILRQMSDLRPISAVKHANSLHTLQIECWFFDNSSLIYYEDRMNTSFPGHEGVSHEISAKYLIFDDFSDLTVFVSACAHLCKLVFIDRTPRCLGTIQG